VLTQNDKEFYYWKATLQTSHCRNSLNFIIDKANKQKGTILH